MFWQNSRWVRARVSCTEFGLLGSAPSPDQPVCYLNFSLAPESSGLD
jgi:hypothetical protein